MAKWLPILILDTVIFNYQEGITAHSSGYSIYLMGLPNKHYLAGTYTKKIGNASISSYCIKFKSLKEVDIAV